MISRRKFIASASVAAISSTAALTACAAPAMAKSAGLENAKNAKSEPVVISTWNFGEQANGAAWKVLKAGGRAIDAVEAGVRVPEADPNITSVGYGGAPDRDGFVTLDACMMDEFGNAGSVCFLQNIMHPISVARKVMEDTPHVMLVGEGALRFALEKGFKKENLLTEGSKKAWEEWKKTSQYKPIINIENHDTIGMLAIDQYGNLGGGCTTSGMAYKMHGRVGDSPIIGAGLFVDNEVGAATSTGLGEAVLRTLGSFLVVELMRQGATPLEACKEAVLRIAKRNKNYKDFQVGFLALHRNGEHGAFSLQKGFNYALHKGGANKIFDADWQK